MGCIINTYGFEFLTNHRLRSLNFVDRACEGRADGGRKRIPDKRVSAGTMLIREWGGVSHRVTVFDHGVVYRGRRYRSLSEVAGVITGARWSGPLFSGLKQRAEKIAHG